MKETKMWDICNCELCLILRKKDKDLKKKINKIVDSHKK